MATNLLSKAESNYKINKNLQGGGFIGSSLFISPEKVGGFGNVCPFASAGCKATCLNTAGKGVFSTVKAGRARKAKMFFKDKPLFFATLKKEIEALVRKGEKEGKKVFVRLNGTSDLNYGAFKVYGGKNIFEIFPTVQFYDYTKDIKKAVSNVEPNYHLTFSRSETNGGEVLQALGAGVNVAVVFKGKTLPETFLGRPVVNGDQSDLRFLEGKQSLIIGLTAKGKARKDESGFAYDLTKQGVLNPVDGIKLLLI